MSFARRVGVVRRGKATGIENGAGSVREVVEEPDIEAYPLHRIDAMASVLLTVNGKQQRIDALPDEPLLSVLRDRLDLTGTKYGCGEGQCGACTVLVDGRAEVSCQMPVSEAAGKKIVTIEGLAQNGRLHPVQAAFLETEAFQCGYCTSGMIVASVALLQTNTAPSAEEIARALARNVCRCGTYPRIVEAVQAAGKNRGTQK
jgi:aerobic-type carbon monoxide dehydrogenase small subunit (CoxS/CutS family)